MIYEVLDAQRRIDITYIGIGEMSIDFCEKMKRPADILIDSEFSPLQKLAFAFAVTQL